MLIGEFRHNIDAKGRISFPARLREALGPSFVITKGLDNCLAVYRLEDWKTLEEKTRALPLSRSRQIQRFLFAGAVLAEPDKQGRVLIPQNLREHAGLTDEVTTVGVSNRVEIWDSARWDALNAELTSESVAETMEELVF